MRNKKLLFSITLLSRKQNAKRRLEQKYITKFVKFSSYTLTIPYSYTDSYCFINRMVLLYTNRRIT